MASLLFYDPDGNHSPSLVDPDIIFVQNMNDLHQRIITDIGLHRVVCLCCPNKSEIIEAIQEYQHIRIIYLCNKHGGRETNPLHNTKVRQDAEFTPTSGWEFKVRLNLLAVCMMHRSDDQVHIELTRLRAIEQRNLEMLQVPIQPMD